MDITTMLGATL